jgi:LysR family glycine cleavage system transcriptional activator
MRVQQFLENLAPRPQPGAIENTQRMVRQCKLLQQPNYSLREQAGLMVDVPRLPSLIAIRAFEAAARHGSFAKAAAELGTTAASVSYHVRRLEQQTGLRLFRRYPQRLELTDVGATIAAIVSDSFASLRAAFVKGAEHHETRLSLTTLPTFGTSWLTPRLGVFRARHPEIRLELDVSTTLHDLGAGRFDAAIRNGQGRWPGLRALELFPSIFMPLCAPALKGAAAGLGDPRRRLDVPLLGRPDWWALWYRALGHSRVDLDNRFGAALAAEHLDAAMAIAGHGITMGSPILFKNEISAGALVPAHEAVASEGRAFWFTYSAALERNDKIVRFRNWLCEEAARDRNECAGYIQKAKLVRSEEPPFLVQS